MRALNMIKQNLLAKPNVALRELIKANKAQ
jgi:hypothetical protein